MNYREWRELLTRIPSHAGGYTQSRAPSVLFDLWPPTRRRARRSLGRSHPAVAVARPPGGGRREGGEP